MTLPTHVVEVLRRESKETAGVRSIRSVCSVRSFELLSSVAGIASYSRPLTDPLLGMIRRASPLETGVSSEAFRCGGGARNESTRHPTLSGQLPAAVVTLIMTAVYSVTYGSILFDAAGMPASFVPNGVTIWLIAGFSSQISLLAASSLPCGLAGATLEMLPIFHAVDANIAKALHGSPPEEIIGTVLATSFATTLGLGLMLVAGAQLGAAKYLRAVPLVVLKGALFGVAIFLLQNSITSAAPVPRSQLLVEWPKWTVAVAVGFVLFLMDEFMRSRIAIPIAFVVLAAFPSIVELLGISSLENLRSEGWVYVRSSGGGSQSWYDQMIAMYGASLPRVSWPTVAKQAPGMMGIWLTHALCTLMDLKASEIITGVEADLATEIRAVGVGNIFSALSGACWPVYMPAAPNISANKLGAGKFVVLLTIAGQVVLLFFAQDLVPRLPRALAGATSWWLGMLFMKETIVDLLKHHAQKYDIIIVLVMAFLMIFNGFINALLTGIILAVGLFTMQYSGSPVVIRAKGDARYFRSNVHRQRKHEEFLQDNSHKIWVIHVDGHVMFGSSPYLSDEVCAALLRDDEGAESVLLNFRGVTGLDYSGALDLVGLGRRAMRVGKRVVITELSGDVLETLLRAGVRLQRQRTDLEVDTADGLCHVEHYHKALKLCEDMLLMSAGFDPRTTPSSTNFKVGAPTGAASAVGAEEADENDVWELLSDTFGGFLQECNDGNRALVKLRQRVRVSEYAVGTKVWSEGDTATFCALVIEGELHGKQSTANGQLRLQEVVSAGAFVGYMALVGNLPYVQTLIVAPGCRCRTVEITAEAFRDFVQYHPELAVAVLRAVLKRGAVEIRDMSRLMASTCS